MKIKYRQGNLKARVFLSVFLGLILLFCLVAVLSTASCKTPEVKIDPVTLLPVTGDQSDSGSITVTPILPTDSNSDNNDVNDVEKKMSGVTWINPGKVNVDGLYPGASGEQKIRIHNPKNTEAVFNIYRKDATRTTEGYTKLPTEYYTWIKISPSTLIVPARSTGEVLVAVTVGISDRPKLKKYETWIGVMDESQEGLVKTEICSRWMMTIR
jgi:hypothetical protein